MPWIQFLWVFNSGEYKKKGHGDGGRQTWSGVKRVIGENENIP